MLIEYLHTNGGSALDRNDAWKKFTETGNVYYYLRYKSRDALTDMEAGKIHGLSEDQRDSYISSESGGS